MVALDYEIKYGKYIAFKHKDKERFTRAKTIGEDYTEDRLKERILDNANQRTYTVKKRIGNIIDIANNEKVKSSKGYEYWATKHNLKTAADTIIYEPGVRTKTWTHIRALKGVIYVFKRTEGKGAMYLSSDRICYRYGAPTWLSQQRTSVHMDS